MAGPDPGIDGPAPEMAGGLAPSERPLKGKVAVVTGAARGIGRATAGHLCRLGARVAVVDIDGDRARSVADGLVASGADAAGLACDVSRPADVTAMMDAVVDRFGGVDLLDHNAAWTDAATDLAAEDVDLATWDRVVATNATAGLLLVRAVLPVMRERGGGAIVFISSGSASIGEHRRVAYGVSKAALEQLTRHVATRYGRDGIRANAVAPGFVLTRSAARAISPEGQALLAAQNPLGRLGAPEDIARVVGFLLSDDAAFVNGQVLHVDGGLGVSPRLAATDA
ncbi:MAG: glucose 1-dehydrogenase [Actinomycetota bacterium]|nr:glucose 1-dehydrogenase [Actinomycetota bacterium]